jgi:hypothetical protein
MQLCVKRKALDAGWQLSHTLPPADLTVDQMSTKKYINSQRNKNVRNSDSKSYLRK